MFNIKNELDLLIAVTGNGHIMLTLKVVRYHAFLYPPKNENNGMWVKRNAARRIIKQMKSENL